MSLFIIYLSWEIIILNKYFDISLILNIGYKFSDRQQSAWNIKNIINIIISNIKNIRDWKPLVHLGELILRLSGCKSQVFSKYAKVSLVIKGNVIHFHILLFILIFSSQWVLFENYIDVPTYLDSLPDHHHHLWCMSSCDWPISFKAF